jgi:hypothetical protein
MIYPNINYSKLQNMEQDFERSDGPCVTTIIVLSVICSFVMVCRVMGKRMNIKSKINLSNN